jgi:hypothetical protein
MKTLFKISCLALFLIIAGFSFISLMGAASAHAQVQIQTTLPNQSSSVTAGQAPGAFVNAFFVYALSIAGIIAFGIIIYGGVKYMISAGNPSGQGDAKEWIMAAIMGILLLAGAYLLLYVINPALVNLALPNLGSVGTGVATGGLPTSTTGAPGVTPTGTCPLAALPTLTDPGAIAMENGQTVVWNSSNPGVQANLTLLQAAVNQMQTMVSGQGGHMTINSVYRPLQYQALFYAIYQDATALKNTPADAQIAACSSLISQLQAEETKHGICTGSKPCLVAAPSGCSDHPRGMGVDISITPSSLYSSINSLLSKNNIPLTWAALGGDPVHFRLTDPASTACVTS